MNSIETFRFIFFDKLALITLSAADAEYVVYWFISALLMLVRRV